MFPTNYSSIIPTTQTPATQPQQFQHPNNPGTPDNFLIIPFALSAMIFSLNQLLVEALLFVILVYDYLGFGSEFIDEVVAPVRKKYRKSINRKVELKV